MSYRPFETLAFDLDSARAQAAVDERAAEELARLSLAGIERARRKKRKADRRAKRKV